MEKQALKAWINIYKEEKNDEAKEKVLSISKLIILLTFQLSINQ